MNAKKIVVTIFKTCFTLGLLLVIAMFVYKMCIKTYDFGYRIFAEEPMSPPPGYTTSVAIVDGKSVMEIGQILEDRGLIRDAYIFYLQELVSDYHGQLVPGVYELSTAMTPEEMMAVMAADYTDEVEEAEDFEEANDYYEGMPGQSDEMSEEIFEGDGMSEDAGEPIDYMDGYQ